MRPVPRLPDSSLVLDARAVVGPLLTPAVLAHSDRVFLLANAWAARRQLAFDEEGLCLAALFHDAGLFAPWKKAGEPFTLGSSGALRDFLEARQIPADRIGRLSDAIELHMMLLPRWSKGPEAGLLQVGAWMDVTGLRRWSVRTEARAIAQAHPRQGFDLEFPGRVLGAIGSVRAATGLLCPAARLR